ncbi:MAG: DGQHR domain-containing protein [Acidobacteriota bacterium]
MSAYGSLQKISVIVPTNPFVPVGLPAARTCLAALDVVKLMEWWPGRPHAPHPDPDKVRAIQRSLDWKRVAQIAAYLLQDEIIDAPERIDRYFRRIYEPKKNDPGRQWPPRIPRVIGFQRSEYPTFSSILLHVNGARLDPRPDVQGGEVANLVFSEDDQTLNFSVIDGQHRINGAFLAVCIRRETDPAVVWQIPTEIFLDLDPLGEVHRQAQIFIDVNFNQKKVDRSLVADLFPTARGKRDPLDYKERAQDLGRKLLLEIGPLVGMIQIPGIKYGVKDVVTLATLNTAIEGVLGDLFEAGLESLDEQAQFLALCLDAWFEATGRREEVLGSESLDPENVAYQGRVVVSFLTLVPACLWKLKRSGVQYISDDTIQSLAKWLRQVMQRAGLLENNRFIPKGKFRQKGFLGSGGLARFRDTLWTAALASKRIGQIKPETLAKRASAARARVRMESM